jgi:hypothetical protein
MNKDINHADRKHALLSASGASRWMNCTPSARLSENIPRKESIFAQEGTFAHEFSENELRNKLGLITEKEYNRTRTLLVKSEFYNDEVLESITEYVDYVLETVAEARSITSDALALIEEKVSLEMYIEQGFGTCDCIIIADGILFVIDLKFGRGVRVSAIENPQLKLYGVGALEKHGLLYDIETVRLVIVQPRLGYISVWDISAEDLLLWAEQQVTEKAKLAYSGEGEVTQGSWCHFCPAKALCPALKEEALLIAQADFSPNNLTLVEELELLEVYEVADRVTSYLEAVKAHIYQRALDGMKFPGLKLVESRTNRKIVDVAGAMKALEANKIDQFMYANVEPKLKSLGDLKKYLGEKRMNDILGDFIVKPEGKPTLTTQDDKREEIDLTSDFI